MLTYIEINEIDDIDSNIDFKSDLKLEIQK